MIGLQPLGEAFNLSQKTRVAVIADFRGIQDRTDLHRLASAQHDAAGIGMVADFGRRGFDAGDRIGFDLRPVFQCTRDRRDRQAKTIGDGAKVRAGG